DQEGFDLVVGSFSERSCRRTCERETNEQISCLTRRRLHASSRVALRADNCLALGRELSAERNQHFGALLDLRTREIDRHVFSPVWKLSRRTD
ncbi:hypothetical protein, partial [Enterococcus faecalis]|uniref:hypothetical protein n=1 Tax=Enterococcus faecalis TaxID=1351 RepID=UPI0025B09598